MLLLVLAACAYRTRSLCEEASLTPAPGVESLSISRALKVIAHVHLMSVRLTISYRPDLAEFHRGLDGHMSPGSRLWGGHTIVNPHFDIVRLPRHASNLMVGIGHVNVDCQHL